MSEPIKWNRATLWGARNHVTELENQFLREQGWTCGSIFDLGLASGLIAWYKTINGIKCCMDRNTALTVAQAELFDRGPSLPKDKVPYELSNK